MDFEFDVFVSHASEDKAAVVEPLVRALEERGLRVWYDRHQIRLGDDLRRKMEEGLGRSAFGVVVLSPSFRKYWPEAELGALLNQERVFGAKKILPVVHGMTLEELTRTWPLLAARAVTIHGSADDLDSVADAIEDAVAGEAALESAADRGHPRAVGTGRSEGAGRPFRGPASPRLTWRIGMALALALVLGVWLWPAAPTPLEATPLVPIFDHIDAQGYAVNRSLAGRYRPGDVLQIADPDPLTTPVLLLRSEMCFPGLVPSVAPFPLPADSASSGVASGASFGLTGAQIVEAFPGLSLGHEAVRSYRLVFEEPRIVTAPKLEMSGRFSEECVLRLDEARAAGDSITDFGTVYEAVIAAGMTLEVQWKRGLSARARVRAKKGIWEKALAVAQPEDESSATADLVQTESLAERMTVWKVEAPITLGYRIRPMQYRPPEDLSAIHPPRSDRAPVLSVPAQLLAAAVLAAGEDEAPREKFTRGEDFIGRLAIQLKTADGWRIVDPQRTFTTGERFRFEVESSQAAKVFVFHQPPDGELAEIWPAQREDANRVAPGESILVPPSAAFQMQDDTGAETFSIALMRAPRRLDSKLGNYVLRSLTRKGTRGVGIVDLVDEEEPRLYFEPGSDGQLAAVDFRLRHAASQ